MTVFMGDILGRRKTIMLGLFIMACGKIIQCTSYSFGQYIAGRFIAGFGMSHQYTPLIRMTAY